MPQEVWLSEATDVAIRGAFPLSWIAQKSRTYSAERTVQNPSDPKPLYTIGATVRVKFGTPSEYPDIPMGGWVGTVREVNQESAPPEYVVELSRSTLDQIHPVYRKRCDRDGFWKDRIWIKEDRIELDTGEPSVIEQPMRIESRPWDDDSVDDWIRGYLGLTTDDPILGQGGHSWTAFQEHFRMVTGARTQAVLGSMYPAISDWVRNHGTIEIGLTGTGTVSARLINSDGVLFEAVHSETLADALNALEEAITRHLQNQSAPK